MCLIYENLLQVQCQEELNFTVQQNLRYMLWKIMRGDILVEDISSR